MCPGRRQLSRRQLQRGIYSERLNESFETPTKMYKMGVQPPSILWRTNRGNRLQNFASLRKKPIQHALRILVAEASGSLTAPISVYRDSPFDLIDPTVEPVHDSIREEKRVTFVDVDRDGAFESIHPVACSIVPLNRVRQVRFCRN